MLDFSGFPFHYANIGKAIAAYERLMRPGPSRFDRYVQALLEGDTVRGNSVSSLNSCHHPECTQSIADEDPPRLQEARNFMDQAPRPT